METKQTDTIDKCIFEIRNGNDNAISHLHTLIGGHISFIAFKFFNNTEDADDAVQDFWYHIRGYCEKYRYVSNGGSFLKKCFTNFCISRLRALGIKPIPIDHNKLDTYDSYITDDSLLARQADLKRSFARARARMSEKERAVFALICYEDANIRQVALQLNCSKSTVARLRKSALDILKQVLIEDGWDKNP